MLKLESLGTPKSKRMAMSKGWVRECTFLNLSSPSPAQNRAVRKPWRISHPSFLRILLQERKSFLPSSFFFQEFAGHTDHQAIGKGRLQAMAHELVQHLVNRQAVILAYVIQQTQGMILGEVSKGRKRVKMMPSFLAMSINPETQH